MASEDIIKHIIKNIVTQSNAILKSTKKDAPLTISDDSILTTLANEIYVNGIASLTQSNLITDTLAAFISRSVVFDPNNEFGMERELTMEQVERLVNVSTLIFSK